MKKKLLSFLLITAMLISISPAQIHAEDLYIDETTDASVAYITGKVQIGGSGGTLAGYDTETTVYNESVPTKFSYETTPDNVSAKITQAQNALNNLVQGLVSRGTNASITNSSTYTVGRVWDLRLYETYDYDSTIINPDNQTITVYWKRTGKTFQTTANISDLNKYKNGDKLHLTSGEYGKEHFYFLSAMGSVDAFSISANKTGNGTVTVQQYALKDDNVQIQLNADDDWMISSVYVGSGGSEGKIIDKTYDYATSDTLSFTMPNKNVQVNVVFKRSYLVYGMGLTKGGSVSLKTAHIDEVYDTPVNFSVVEDEQFIMTAMPQTNYDFDGWYEGTWENYFVNGNNGNKITDQAALIISASEDNNGSGYHAVFTPKTVTVTFESNGGTMAEADKQQTIAYNTKPSAPQTNPVKTGLNFWGWSSKMPSQMTYYDVWHTSAHDTDFFNHELTENTTYYATYWANLFLRSYYLTNSQDYAGGYVGFSSPKRENEPTATNIEDSVIEGTAVTLTAIPAAGNEFVCWSTSNSVDDSISTDPDYSFTFGEKTTLYALFRKTHTHQWGDPEYTWLDNNTKAKAKRVCILDPTHVEEETVSSTSQTVKAATCSSTGDTKYTAVFSNPAFSKMELTVEGNIPVDKNAHKYDSGTVTKEATCTEKGEKTFVCEYDETHTRKEEITALGHLWGEWKVTSEPTRSEMGVETRICSRDNTHTENRYIPVLTYRNTSGDGSSYRKGTGSALSFTYSRSYNDPVAITHFAGIKVDGTQQDKDKYTAKAGSVVLILKPEYLDTLGAGEHTLTAMFDDGDDVTVIFYIREKKSDDPSKQDSSEPKARIPKTGIE